MSGPGQTLLHAQWLREKTIVFKRLKSLFRIRSGDSDGEPWRPSSYQVVETAVGANVNYDCYCGCDAGFALDRSSEDLAPEKCCCGNQILVGNEAAQRLRTNLDQRFSYRIDVRSEPMPWGINVEVALAVPEKHSS